MLHIQHSKKYPEEIIFLWKRNEFIFTQNELLLQDLPYNTLHTWKSKNKCWLGYNACL